MSTDQWIAASITLGVVIVGIVRNEFAINTLGVRLSDSERHLFGRIDSLQQVMNAKFETVEQRFITVGERLTGLEKLFDEKLRRVEEVLDARLKHLEEKVQ